MALDTIRCGDLRPAPGHLEIIYSAVLTLILVATVSSNVYVFVRLVKVPSKWTSCKKIAQYLLCMGSFEAVLSTSVTSTTTVAGKIIVRDGPFDIQGGGLGFSSRQVIFFSLFAQQVIFCKSKLQQVFYFFENTLNEIVKKTLNFYLIISCQ